MSAEPPIIRRGASHDTIWRLWSAAQVRRLVGLPAADLLLAVQTGAIGDLTPDDQGQVLAALAASGYRHVSPTMVKGRRRPLPFKGKGLPCRVPALVQPSRTRVWIALILAIATWGTSIGLSCAHLASHFEDVP